MKKGKKGDVSSAFLITLILAVLAFVIVLIVYAQFNWTVSADQETCHQSVIYRATLTSAFNAKNFVPLKCKTEKICFTSGVVGGKCKVFENTPGVTNFKVSNKDQIEQAIAREIIDCWTMMGESKLSLFNDWMAETYGINRIASSCVVCSRIAFDKESLAKKGIDTSEINVVNYMMKHKIPNKNLTYYDYLGGSKGQISVTTANLEKTLTDLSERLSGKLNESSGSKVANPAAQNSGSDEIAIMFMQVIAPTYGEVFKNTVFSLLGGGTFVYLGGGGKLVSVLCKGPLGVVCGILGATAAVYQFQTVFINNAFAAGLCGDVIVGDKAETGCSVVRTVNYGEDDLSQYCSTIESIG
ncbi:MAG: hypothetical protein PHF67_03220 [Candidatus Nanoarchaeia archaeon]|nr:hypothetical protein [Candidatus Nanoarchaeia archaeon]